MVVPSTFRIFSFSPSIAGPPPPEVPGPRVASASPSVPPASAGRPSSSFRCEPTYFSKKASKRLKSFIQW